MAYQMAATTVTLNGLWRSFTGCRPFKMQSIEHLWCILHDFNWQCTRTVPLH